jgi:phenylacetate-coenzyme A ligase PaaK-like adenylate-forming protein
MLQRWACSLRQFFECGGKWNYKQMEFRNKDDILTHNQRKIVNWALPKYVQVPINKLSLDVAASYLLKDTPEVVFGYPSFLLSLAETLLGKTDTKIVFVTGEILTSHYRKIIGSKFCGNLIDTYGCTETGDIAWECPNEHAGYHMNVDSVFVEFIKEGENVSSGEEGEIVLTDLTNMAMPFIRYKI